MISKLYDKMKQFCTENFLFLITVVVMSFICFIPFPYYIEAPGGIMDISEKIEVKDQTKLSGSLNLVYVVEYKATIPTLLFAFLHPDWDVLTKEEVMYENESAEDAEFRNHILLEEGNQNAMMIAMDRANVPYKIEDRTLFVTYVDKDAKTSLKVGDELLSVNGIVLESKQQLETFLRDIDDEETITFEVRRDGEVLKQEATVYSIEDRWLVGIMVSELKKLNDNDIVFHFEKDESGPSGGFMMTLALYQALLKEDLTNGRTIVGTGTIDEKGRVGSIGGVTYKLKGAVKSNADLFFVPDGENYKEAMKVKKEEDFDIEIVKIKTIDEAIRYLKET